MKKVFLVLLAIPVLISAQQFKFGFDTEFSYIRITDDQKTHALGYESFIPVTFNLLLEYDVNEDISLKAHVGKTLLAVEFSGYEFGLGVSYKFYKPFYLSSGFMYHSNEGGDLSISHGVNFAALYLITAGVGYNFSDSFSLGLNYYFPLKKEKLIYYNFPPQSYSFYSMLRLNFVFLWSL